jgi:hypothetical protein
MGLDFINEQDIRDKIVDPAITRLNIETIPALQSATIAALNLAFERVRSEVMAATDQLAGLMGHTINDVQLTLRMINGASLTIKPVTLQVSLSEIRINLNLPPQPEAGK